jgi:hypothetical protein
MSFDLGPPLTDRLAKRFLLAGPLFLAGYIVLQCPCGKLPSCHKEKFYSLIAFSVIAAWLEMR